MRSTGRSFVIALILVASAAFPLAAQNRMRIGDQWPTTDLTASQRRFAEAYLAAVKGPDIEPYKRLLHPATLACMNKDNADFFNGTFKRRVNQAAPNPGLSVETLPAKFPMFDALNAHGWNYPLKPTHAFHIQLVSAPPVANLNQLPKQTIRDVSIIAFAAQDNGVWYEVLPCPSKQALDAMR